MSLSTFVKISMLVFKAYFKKYSHMLIIKRGIINIKKMKNHVNSTCVKCLKKKEKGKSRIKLKS